MRRLSFVIGVLLISFSQTIAGPLVDNGDGTITDTTTKLRWQKCSAGQNNDSTCSGSAVSYNWRDALSYCKNLSLSGRIWRLPSIREWRSIIDRSRSPAIDLTFFPNTTVGSSYSTSTTSQGNIAAIWVILPSSGSTCTNSVQCAKTVPFSVRCVSTGP